MEEQFKQRAIAIVFGFLVLAIVVAIGFYFISMIDPIQLEENQKMTNIKCCGGENNYCTDTYYDKTDGKCHSTFMLIELMNGNIGWLEFLAPILATATCVMIILFVLFWIRVRHC